MNIAIGERVTFKSGGINRAGHLVAVVENLDPTKGKTALVAIDGNAGEHKSIPISNIKKEVKKPSAVNAERAAASAFGAGWEGKRIKITNMRHAHKNKLGVVKGIDYIHRKLLVGDVAGFNGTISLDPSQVTIQAGGKRTLKRRVSRNRTRRHK